MHVRRGLLTLSLMVSAVAWPLLVTGAPPAGAAVPQQPSAGCGSGTVAPPSGTTVDYSAAGDTGSYLVEGTTDQHPRQPLPLIVDLHGYSETADIQAVVSKLGDYGAAHGFLTVTPQVDEAVQHWTTSPHSADQRFLIALIGHVTNTLCVDRHRIFVAGYSNGAFMASALACSDARTIAAVATVAGIEADAGCHPSQRVPVIAFHGTADPFVPYKGGIGPAAKNLPATDGKGTIGSDLTAKSNQGIEQNDLPVPVEAARWAARNGCAKTPEITRATTDVTMIAYHCPHDAAVVLYRENGAGHIWAGSQAMPEIASTVGKTTFSISADQLMWTFFQNHPR